MNSFAQLLMYKGQAHEEACLAEYESQGLLMRRIPQRDRQESFATWTARVGDVFADGWDVLYQVPLVDDGVRGIADFLLRVQARTGR